MIQTRSAGVSEFKASGRKTRPKPTTRSAARRRTGARTPTAETDDQLNSALLGVDDGRGDDKAADASVEDPLRDWPEGAASGDDAWLSQRGGEGMQKPEE